MEEQTGQATIRSGGSALYHRRCHKRVENAIGARIPSETRTGMHNGTGEKKTATPESQRAPQGAPEF